MRQKYYAKKIIQNLKANGTTSFTIDDLKAENVDIHSSHLIAARYQGLIKKGEYNKAIGLQTWIIL